VSQDILDRLQVDPSRRTFGELLQEREAAVQEIRRLRAEYDKSRSASHPTYTALVHAEQSASEEAPRPQMLFRLNDLCDQLGVSRSTIYNWLTENKFPVPVRIGVRAVRWRVEDIERWCNALEPASL
jgi:prophage regulatory protein